MHKRDFSRLRKEYAEAGFDETMAGHDPFLLFSQWFDQALESELPEPNAMTLATSDHQGKPSARVVLLKELDNNGFVFYTNYQSRKAQELDMNPHAALVFLWLEIQRQVRVEGYVERVSPAESDAYFALRPRDSQLGALASPQSQPVPSARFLEEKFLELKSRFENLAIPRPPHWGGYRLIPTRWEFWQGRMNRLHDRIAYVRQDDKWQVVRLAP
jgi:pyridoxamine 5'-phosphate oxidase